jgi:glutaredoxin
MKFFKKHNSAIAYLLTLFTLTNVIGCSQESPQAKTAPNTTTPAITASPVAAIATTPKRTFTPEIVKSYVEGCQASGGTKTYCNCFIGKIKVSFSPDEFDQAGETFKLKGKIPDAITKSMKACEPAPVPTAKPTTPSTNQPQNQSAPLPAPANDNAEQQLAQHLKKIGAVMYGTYWCPYCTKQKKLFGEAISEVQYVECDPRGNNASPELCESFGVRSFPTWQINGQSYSGSRDLKDIATISGYTGSRNFKY